MKPSDGGILLNVYLLKNTVAVSFSSLYKTLKVLLFLSRFSFTNMHVSQGSRERARLPL